jgi:RNA polymerase-binding transcription factor DksA
MASKKGKKAPAAAGKAKKGTVKTAVRTVKTVKKAVVAKKSATPAKAVAKKRAAPAKAPAARKGGASLTAIRDLLLRELARIQKHLGMIQNDDTTVEAANVGDLADAAAQDEVRVVLRGLQQTEAEQLEQIKGALARIEAGAYGTCVRCGCQVEEARLEALPHAPTCINCRRREERGEFKGR